MKQRPWNSEKWLRWQYLELKRTPQQIAQESKGSVATIYRKLREFGLIK
jgi:hypothetical protein